MTTAFVFPGQGSQAIGMGRLLADNFASARAVFAEVDEALQQKLSNIMWEGPEADLTLTENAQPALMAVSMAATRMLEAEHGITVANTAKFVAGHSLGEYAALAAAGTFTIADAARLDLSYSSRFDLAYNAAHAFALVALRRAGYRSDNRYLVFQALAHTVGMAPERWRILAKAHENVRFAEYNLVLRFRSYAYGCRTVLDGSPVRKVGLVAHSTASTFRCTPHAQPGDNTPRPDER